MKDLVVSIVIAVLLASCATNTASKPPILQESLENTSITESTFPESNFPEVVEPVTEIPVLADPLPLPEEDLVAVDEELVLPESDVLQLNDIMTSEDTLEQSFTIVLDENGEARIRSSQRENAPLETNADTGKKELEDIVIWGDPDKAWPALILEEDGSLKVDFGRETRWSADIGIDHGAKAMLLYRLEWDFGKPKRK